MDHNKFIEISDLGVSPDYLIHHQIKGAKWGVFRGPPYPLGSGINTRVKRRTKKAEQRAEKAKTKKKPMTKKQAQEIQRKRAQEEDAKSKFPKNQKNIDKMSNKQLQKAIERLKLENAYKEQLPKEPQGKHFLDQAAETLKRIRVLSDETAQLVDSSKKLAKAFGLMKKDNINMYNMGRLPGETPEAYAKRLKALKSINDSLKGVASGKSGSGSNTKSKPPEKSETERKAADRAAEKAAEKAEQAARKKANKEAEREAKRESRRNDREAASKRRENEREQRSNQKAYNTVDDFLKDLERMEVNDLPLLPGAVQSSYWDQFARTWR